MEVILADLSIVQFCVPKPRISQLPEVLGHHANIDYLSGVFSLHRIQKLPSAVELALRDYSKQADLLRVVNGEMDGLPSLEIRLRRRLSDGGVEVFHKIADQEAFGALPRGPKLILILENLRNGGEVITTSLAPALSPSPAVFGRHVVYAHTFADREFRGISSRTGLSYIGVTRQGWPARWAQHLNSAAGGSTYHFHRAIRDFSATHSHVHQILSSGLNHEDAMSAEEQFVEHYSLYPRGLNMIPGGHAGIRYLAKYGFKTSNRDWENRHAVLRRFGQYCDRAGKPNPLAAARWRDDGYAASVICANPNNFNQEQVQEIRLLDTLEWRPEQIAERLSCNAVRVQRLLRGETYARVH